MEIEEIKKVIFEKGDVFLIKIDHRITHETIDILKESVDKALVKTGLEPGDVTVLIFENNVEFEIWRSRKEITG